MRKLASLQQLISETSIVRLEAALETGNDVLREIRSAFADATSVEEVAKWVKQADELLAQSRKQRTVVGVVGSTGAGKSSMINAVLDEENLVPTNGMRACTATITEIQFNETEDEQAAYRAEIHFIHANDWIQELHALRGDLREPDGDLVGAEQLGSEPRAAIAYDKIRSVYPQLSKEDVAKHGFSPEALAHQAPVKQVLGTVKVITAPTSSAFTELLREYIDSKDRIWDHKNNSDRMEFWPLVKFVRVFVRSRILEPGMVLVDLPGLHDSNAARSAVAARYLQQCTGLWVVAPITRIVDDKVAQNLLGMSFKRQLQFDGLYSAITVVCTKTDDISVTEALRSMPMGHSIRQDCMTMATLEKTEQRLIMESSLVNKRIADLSGLVDKCEEDVEQLELSLESQDNETLDDNTNTSSSEEDSLDDSAERQEKRVDSREEAIRRLASLRAEKKAIRAEKSDLQEKAKSLREDLDKARFDIGGLKSGIKSACIQYRNQYSRPVIRQQFAEGLKELDEESLSGQGEGGHDNSYAQRLSKRSAARLPVFCVSGRAYQRMSGMLRNDEPDRTGYLSLEETEITALQQHAQRTDLKDEELAFLEKSLKELSLKTHSAVVKAVDRCDLALQDALNDNFASAATRASKDAPGIAKSWGKPKRDGDLCRPLLNHIALPWERAFSRTIPDIIDALGQDLSQYLSEFQDQMHTRPHLKNSEPYEMVSYRVKNQADSLRKAVKFNKLIKLDDQKKANRSFKPAVQKAMQRAYMLCKSESGTGSFERMKRYMAEQVRSEKKSMFDSAVGAAQDSLEDLLDKLQQNIKSKVEEAIREVSDDYITLIEDHNVLKALTSAQKKIRVLLNNLDSRFQPVLEIPVSTTIGHGNKGDEAADEVSLITSPASAVLESEAEQGTIEYEVTL
ncbi:unnamed protein product [Sordaria macrospora k-hell]|uniref:WGS project CABT00000000 data, contig 2.5 n=1 Tax=Sordaria macrospora (strain ATCC MYA-333 / DSM 997 / K(L3346) / K-hell) TaxID=771870 RepID=F7VSD9_SORMK|nr:uncharacterized protein SMAC_01969 [Sordaria macrospora k-hell]CCC08425.1 unnamed protein product [Sordaria macrospora k-hell]